MGGMHLAIDQAAVLGAQVRNPVCQGEFGSIVMPGKHRLPKEYLADPQTIQTADEFVIQPGFRRVCPAQTVQFAVGGDHFFTDPGAVLAWAWSLGTGTDHAREIAVVSEDEA